DTAISYKAIPGIVYTNPEFAGVGKTEEQLKTEGVAYEAKNISMSFSGRFVAENEMVNGVCKILYNNEQEILGFHILGNPASELIVIAGMAIEKNMKMGDLREMVFPHPTVSEIIRESLY
ncbi:MAG: dihydrolipoyl dehydrogenase, partial [Tannerellaceae bacterium]